MAERHDRPDQAELDELGEEIAEARRDAEEEVPGMGEHGAGGMFTDSEPAFHDSGDYPAEDDQNIVPPG